MNDRVLKIIIVDDEIPIIDDLKLIKWKDMDVELIGTASDGEEAFNLVEKLRPDIVILDITMPIMDGLELTKKLKDTLPNIMIIILSCHSEIRYAQEAMRIGASDYLLKVGITFDELKSTIDRIRIKIGEYYIEQNSKNVTNRLKIGKLIANKVFEQDNVKDNLIDELTQAGMNVSFPYRFYGICVQIINVDYAVIDIEISEVMDKQNDWVFWTELGLGTYGLFCKLATKHSEALEKIEVLVNEINKSLNFKKEAESWIHRVYSYTSDEINNVEDILKNVRNLNALKDTSFYEEDTVIFYGQCNNLNSANEAIVKEFCEIFDGNDIESEIFIKKLENNFLTWGREKRLWPHELKWIFIEWLGKCRKSHSKGIGLTQKIWQAMTLTGLIESIVQEFNVGRGNHKNLRYVIRKAIQIINSDISKNIRLNDIAEMVGLSPFYFSRIFNSEVGENFNEYITHIRIDKAIELLKNSNLKVYEVAEQVGIPNYRYFSNIFKSWTGLTPKDYRKG